MRLIHRRRFLASASAAPFALWATSQARGAVVATRYDAASPEGQTILEKYARAVKAMIESDDTDAGRPSSWMFQWYTHAVRADRDKESEINRIYGTQSPTDPQRLLATQMWNTCQSHEMDGVPQDERMFLPWHRMYVYFFEQMVRRILGDESFTLPYWDYTTPGKSSIPEAFRNPSDPLLKYLYRADRNAGERRTANVNAGQAIDINAPGILSPIALNQTSYEPQGQEPGFCAALDGGLHGNVHVAVGSRLNMGNVPWAARDPIFWLHHCNIDRLWASWNHAGGKNPSDNSWLMQRFIFADADDKRVNTPVGDFVTTESIVGGAYRYDQLVSTPPIVAELRPTIEAPVPITPTMAHHRIELASDQATVVPLGKRLIPASESTSKTRTYLLLRGLQAIDQPGVTYSVYLQAEAPGGGFQSFVGSINFFSVMTAAGDHAMPGRAVEFVFDVTEGLAKLPSPDSAISVKVVPNGEADPKAVTSIGDIRLIQQ